MSMIILAWTFTEQTASTCNNHSFTLWIRRLLGGSGQFTLTASQIILAWSHVTSAWKLGNAIRLPGAYAPEAKKKRRSLKWKKNQDKIYLCTLSHPNVACKFGGKKVKHFCLCKKKKKTNWTPKFIPKCHLKFIFLLTKHRCSLSHENCHACLRH